MTASNDNRRVRKQRGRGPESIAKMARVLADIYASPPTAIVNQEDLSARLEEGAPTTNEG
jgi:hypothetical protein